MRARLHRVYGLLAALLALIATGYQPCANDWFVSPDGKSTNEGTIANPWDLASAILPGKSVKPDDTIWLRAGTYRNARSEFAIRLSGEPNQPVTIRSYRAERVTIDGAVNVDANDVWVWGLEVMISAPRPDKPLPPSPTSTLRDFFWPLFGGGG